MTRSTCITALLVAFVSLPSSGQTAITAAQARAQAAMAIAPLSCSSAPLLACGSSVTASPSCLTDQYFVDLYTFSASAGQAITLTATTSTSYQMLVTVQGSNGSILTSKFGPSPVTLTYTFASSDTYFIGFGFVAQFATGTYNLRVSCATTTPACQSLGTIALGSSVSGQLTPANGTACLGGTTYSGVYGFFATKDASVLITFTSSFAPYVEVSPPGFDVGIWKSANGPGSIALTFLPAVTGNHWIYFTSNTTGPTTGSYSVKLELAPFDPCRHRAVSH
jgi:hypothetical protein